MHRALSLPVVAILLVAPVLLVPASGRAEEPGKGEPEPAAVPTVTVQGERPHPMEAAKARYVAGSTQAGESLRGPALELADVLGDAPGAQITQTGGFGAPATASIRGATAAQTPVYLGSVRINDEVGGAANLADIPLFLIDRVELYRSHAPIVADRWGVGGAIFLEPRAASTTGAHLGTLVGSYHSRSVWADLAFADGARGALAGVEVAAAGNDYRFENDQGTLFVDEDETSERLSNADAHLTSAFLHLEEPLGEKGRLRVLALHVEREQGVPRLALSPSRAARARSRRELAAVSARSAPGSLGFLELMTAFTGATTEIEDPQGELSLGTPLVSTPGERLEQSLSLHQLGPGELRLSQHLSVAIDRLRRREGGLTARSQVLSSKRVRSRVAASAEVPVVGPYLVEAAAAFECGDTGLGEIEACRERAATGRGGLGYHRERVRAYLNAGHYQRLPTLGELYGVGLLVRGNPELAPEVGETVELGGRYLTSRQGPLFAWVDVAVFTRKTRQQVSYRKTGRGFVPVNLGRTRTHGAELGAGLGLSSWARLAGIVSLLDARETTPGDSTRNDVLPFLSRLTFVGTAELRRELGGSVLHQGGVSARYHYRSSQYVDPAGLVVIPAQGILDAGIFASTVNDTVTVRLRLENLVNARHFDVIGFPLPPRSAFLSLEAAL